MDSDLNDYPEALEKDRVLDVRPLRCLVPVFQDSEGMSSITTPHPAPFVCVSPCGPFPPEVQPFYPFMVQSNQSRQDDFGFGGNIPDSIRLNSFGNPTSYSKGSVGRHRKVLKCDGSEDVVTNDERFSSPQDEGDRYQYVSGFRMNTTSAEGTSNSGKAKGQLGEKKDSNGEEASLVKSFLTLFKLDGFDAFKRSTGDKETVNAVLLVYDLLRKRLTQLEEARDSNSGSAKRLDLKAANLLMSKGVRTNSKKRIGHVPGVEVGDIFYYRMELCIVGLHAPNMAGIDYMSVKLTMAEELLAVSIVSSGGYDDVGDDSNVIIYSGQGGVQRRDGQMFDQKLERGNLALEMSLHQGNTVRVIRGVNDAAAATGRIYVYDGLYKIQESWVEKNNSGCTVFKYKLVREPGQPESFSLWKSVQQWKGRTAARPGITLPNLTLGAESWPVSVVNDVDDEKKPAHFNYIPNLKYSQPFTASSPSVGCRCLGGCQPGDTRCPCNEKNNGFLPYSSNGVLLTNKTVIHECGTSCACPESCQNRISQAGIRVWLEVFKTKDRGWGLRSWDPIRAGDFICEYAGDIINASGGDDSSCENDNDYLFDTTRCYEPLEPSRDATMKAPYPLVISAKNNGNVARFMNHSCSPNVFWQPIFHNSNNDVYLHIAFFAIRHIPPMQELTYDYGIAPLAKREKGKKCLCGTPKCRKYFF